MKSGFAKTIRFVVFLSIGVLLLWLAFRGIDFKKLGSILLKANYLWLLFAILISILAFIIRARRWILLMEPLGIKPSLRNTYHSLLTGYLANMAFPRLGEITRCAALSKKEKVPFDKLVGTVILERTIDLITVLVIMAFLIIYGSASSGAFLSENIFNPISVKLTSWVGFSSAIYAVMIGLVALALWIITKYKNKLSKNHFFKKAFGFLSGILDGLKAIVRLKRKWEFLLLTVLLWSGYLLMSWLPLYCLESTGSLGIGGAIFILVIGSLGMAVPVPSGIGAFHFIVSRGINVVYGVPLEEGLAYATLAHESQIILIAILGAVSMYALFRKLGGTGLKQEENTEE